VGRCPTGSHAANTDKTRKYSPGSVSLKIYIEPAGGEKAGGHHTRSRLEKQRPAAPSGTAGLDR